MRVTCHLYLAVLFNYEPDYIVESQRFYRVSFLSYFYYAKEYIARRIKYLLGRRFLFALHIFFIFLFFFSLLKRIKFSTKIFAIRQTRFADDHECAKLRWFFFLCGEQEIYRSTFSLVATRLMHNVCLKKYFSIFTFRLSILQLLYRKSKVSW